MSFKILIPTLGLAAVVFSSCAPLTPYRPAPPMGTQPVLTPEQRAAEAKAAEQKRIEAARAEARRRAKEREDALNGGSSPSPGDGASGGSTTTNPSGKPDYRRAIPIPGKEGFVFNPFTNNPVDVRGIPSGTLVRDPQDPNETHKFRVP